MSRILSFILLLVLLGVALGFFRGWFSLSTSDSEGQGSPTTQTAKDELDVHFRVDKDKMKQDANAVQENTNVLLGKERSDSSLPR